MTGAPLFGQTVTPTYVKNNQTASADATVILDKNGVPLGTTTNPVNVLDPNTVILASSIYAPIPAETTHGVNIGGVEGITVAGTSGAYPVTIQGNSSGVAVPVSGTFWQATQPISASALPLPSGAATAANQPALNGDGGALAHVTNWPSAQPVGAGAFAASQASIGSSAGLIVAARTGAPGTGRIAVTIQNNGSATVFVGAAGVTTAAGMPLAAGAAITINTTAAVYGIAASGTQTIGVLETY